MISRAAIELAREDDFLLIAAGEIAGALPRAERADRVELDHLLAAFARRPRRARFSAMVICAMMPSRVRSSGMWPA